MPKVIEMFWTVQGAVLFLLVMGALSVADGAGMTAHITIGEKAITELSDADLASLLAENRSAFRSGTLFPDQAMSFFVSKGGSWKTNNDGLSHAAMDGTLGIVNEYLRELQTNCPSLTATAECREATARRSPY